MHYANFWSFGSGQVDLAVGEVLEYSGVRVFRVFEFYGLRIWLLDVAADFRVWAVE